MTIVSHREWEFESPLVLVGFPSQGLVGAIAASFLVPHLKMELVATMGSPYFPPVASVRDGRAMAPVQFYATRRQCGPDGRCSQLVVARSDAVPAPEHANQIAAEILAWAQEVGTELVVSLEGAEGAPDDNVYAVANLLAEPDVKALGAQPFGDGSMAGMSAALLTQGNTARVPVVCLFTGVREEVPDAAAAARLVRVADNLIPGIAIEVEPLLEQAQRMEQQIRGAIAQQRKAQERPEDRYIM